jgi:hypothetical protein
MYPNRGIACAWNHFVLNQFASNNLDQHNSIHCVSKFELLIFGGKKIILV